MPWLNTVLVLFSLLNIGLGIYGYVAKNTLVSLIAGVVIGLLMLGTVALAKTHPRWGRIGSLVLCVAVLGQFAPKFIKTQDWVPAGILTVVAAIVVVCLGVGHMLGMKAKNASTPTA
ncbi:MAG: TMEM14 family protein [Chlorobia bacterium]|nr:TMEM14 family protein [Fimbriimonadaceae bacterium]